MKKKKHFVFVNQIENRRESRVGEKSRKYTIFILATLKSNVSFYNLVSVAIS